MRDRHRPRRQRAAEARRADDRRAPARERQRSPPAALARVAGDHELVVSHGNGPQVGLLALQAAAYKDVEAYPLDILGAETQGMIGYLLEQELGNRLPFEVPAGDDPDDGRGRSGRPRVRRPDEVRRADLRRGAGERRWRRRRAGPSSRTARTGGGSCRRRGPRGSSRSARCAGCSSTAPSSSAPGGGGIPTMYAPGEDRRSGRRRGGHRQGPRQQPARPRARRRPVRDGDRRRRGVRATGARRRSGGIEPITPAELEAMEFAAGSMGPKVEAAGEFVDATGQASGDRIARADRRAGRRHSWDERRARRTLQCSERSEIAMTAVRRPFRGRQAPAGHRPPAGPQPAATHAREPRRAPVRRRPVGRASATGARPVRRADARTRRRGLLRPGPAGRGARGERRGPAAAHRTRRVASTSSGRASWTRSGAALAALPPDALARHLIGGLTVAESGLDLGRLARHVAHRRGDRRRGRRSSCRRCRTRSSRATRRAGSTAASRSTRCTGRRAGARPTTWPRSTAPTRCSSDAAFEYWYPPHGRRRPVPVEDFGLASLEGGDVEIIGKGTVAIGLSERTTARMIEQIARALFAKGAAERVIAAVMTKDRAHMHLDTVFTHARSRQGDGVPAGRRGHPGDQPAARARSPEPSTSGRTRTSCRRSTDALGIKKLHVVETGGDALPAGARAVGRRQQRRRPRARRGRRLRAQHLHHLEDARGRRRGRDHRGVRAGQGPRRRALHDLPGRARPDLRDADRDGPLPLGPGHPHRGGHRRRSSPSPAASRSTAAHRSPRPTLVRERRRA